MEYNMEQRLITFKENITMKLITFIFALLLSGCAVDITTKSFVYQADDVDQSLDLGEIQTTLTNAPVHSALSTVSLTSHDFLTLNGIKLIHEDAKVNVVLFSGNGMTITNASKILNHFVLLPANVIWFDYRGMGLSAKSDSLTIAQLKTDALNVFDFARQSLPKNLPMLTDGISMGSLLAGYVASQRNVDGLVLDGAINSVPQLVDNLMPTWSKIFSTVTVSPELTAINNSEIIKLTDTPLLLLAGEDDSTTPLLFAQQLYDASPSKNKVLAIIPDTEHAQPMTKDESISAYKLFIASLSCCANG
ncbi:MAG: pimeloyl-ACP methyl ester carboxylesterase [Paraglaciecola sp.]|jgi:pimeloyl-ACP methyl ester carboxylesterase